MAATGRKRNRPPKRVRDRLNQGAPDTKRTLPTPQAAAPNEGCARDGSPSLVNTREDNNANATICCMVSKIDEIAENC